MSYQHHHDVASWRIFADRFIWSDENALSLVPEEITDEEIQKYLYTYHGDKMTIDEIRQWRAARAKEQ